MSQRQKVLLIGWDAADWKIINPLLDRGLMPALSRMVERGVMGNIATLQPILSPMLWNSIATGKTADQHGILGFMEPDPESGAVRPVTSTSRRVKALWNIATQSGLRAHVLGWFAGHPAEPINGVDVSPLYPHACGPMQEPWPLPNDCVHPTRLRDTLAQLRVHPHELGAGEVLPFVPGAARIDQTKDPRLAAVTKILAECCSIHNAATWVMEHEPWDFCAVYYDAIDHFCHAFMPFHPPRMEGVPEDLFETYKDVVTAAYRFHDMLLGRLLALAGEETAVMLVSDHGFHSDHLRPRGIPNEPAGPAVCHRPLGVFAMTGPGVRRDERVYGATLLDIAPTVLTLLGLPVGRDMSGRVLVQCFEEPVETAYIASWEDQPGDSGMHPPGMRTDAESLRAIVDQFVALGYVEAPGEDAAQAVATAVAEQRFNLARVYLDTRRAGYALPILEELCAAHPGVERFAMTHAQCLLALGRGAESSKILLKLVGGGGNSAWRDLLLGMIRFEDRATEGAAEDALEYLLRAERAEPTLPNLHLHIGNAYLRTSRWSDAGRAFARAAEIDPDSAQAHLGQAMAHLRRRQNPEAAREALTAVGLLHFLPMGHFVLGVSLTRLGHWERAVAAFQTALTMAPGMHNAHRWLAAIYSGPGGNLAKAAGHRDTSREITRAMARPPVSSLVTAA